MKFLSWLFFCLSPFALFCSGSGLILCPTFIILGLVFKYAENNCGGKAVVKIEPQKFWEWHYKDRMSNTLAQKDSIGEGLMASRDEEARRWATTICGYHNAWVPPEDKQEEIARANGVVTSKMIQQRIEKKDRIQIGRYFLLQKLKEAYKKCLENGELKPYSNGNPERVIDDACSLLRLSKNENIDEWNVKRAYNKSIIEIYKSLTEEEKSQVIEWANEFADKLYKAIKEHRYLYRIDMDYWN